ncbi:M23 family metallopeptidase [Bacillus sp. T33-2]|uniref:M23 family metallopeptidase n=1 Tax=Bacillus sp. T33-2 TaxID=2054168 RepID=UPI000C78DC05|nr:M23 family metallopeptidase [Bacillus sp. T33-2]PLR96483.1 peptidase M23 [Bacillus sp. T33-2]
MENLKKKLSRFSGKSSFQMKPVIKKAVITAFAVSALSFGAGDVTLAADSNLTTVYYVYANDKFIGTVSDKAKIEKLVQEKIDGMKEEFKDLNLSLDSDVNFVPEQVFRSAAGVNTDQVAKVLDEQFNVQAEAVSLVIDGETVAHLKDPAAAESVINQLKLQFVSQEQLTEIETRKNNPNLSLPQLQENETRILDVRLSKKVSFSEEKIDPKQVLTIEEAVNLLKKGTLEEKKYKVKEGDVLGGIADAHGLQVAELISLNPGLTEDTVLKIDQEVNVTVLEPFVDVVVDEEIYQKEAIAFQKEIVTDSSMFKDDTKVQQAGQNGINGVTYQVSKQNGIVIQKQAVKSDVLQEPVKEIVIKGTKVMPSRGEGSFVWPASGGYVSSHMGYRWGRQHKGIDIARPSNYTIKAADNGVVVSAGWDGGYGNKVIIDHQNGYRTVYAHLASMNVSPGQTVPRGSQIGVMGATGDSTGVHLHFEVYKNGSLVDPITVLR